MTVFRTYLDVSRDEGDSNVYMLAGFISDTERWAAFDVEWRKVLDCYNIPAFHMTDFESGYGDFKGWEPNDPRRVPLLTALLGVIERNTVGSVGFGVSQSMFDSVVPPDVLNMIGGSPYFFLFLNLLLGAERLMSNAAKLFLAGVPYDWRMIYMLARGDQGAGTVVETWMSPHEAAKWTRLETHTQGLYIVEDNKDYPALEAADVLAFEGRKQVGLQLGEHARRERRSFTALDKSRGLRAWHFYQHAHHLKANVDGLLWALEANASGTALT